MRDDLNQEINLMIKDYQGFLSSIPDGLNRERYAPIFILQTRIEQLVEKLRKTSLDPEFKFNVLIKFEDISGDFKKVLADPTCQKLSGVMIESQRMSILHETFKDQMETLQKLMEESFKFNN